MMQDGLIPLLNLPLNIPTFGDIHDTHIPMVLIKTQTVNLYRCIVTDLTSICLTIPISEASKQWMLGQKRENCMNIAI